MRKGSLSSVRGQWESWGVLRERLCHCKIQKASPLAYVQRSSLTVWAQGQFCGRHFSLGWGGAGRFQDDSSTWPDYPASDLAGGGPQAVTQAMGGSRKHRWSFTCYLSCSLLLCDPVSNSPIVPLFVRGLRVWGPLWPGCMGKGNLSSSLSVQSLLLWSSPQRAANLNVGSG